jgi:bacteriorhodopsin
MSLLSGLIINFLAVVCLENQRNKYATLLLIPTLIILIYITLAVFITLKTLLLPFMPEAP